MVLSSSHFLPSWMGVRVSRRTAPHQEERPGPERYSRRDNGEVTGFDDLQALPLRRIWDGVAARVVSGERLSFGVVELEPGAVVPEHRHEHEQLGMVLRGSIRFRVGDEERELAAGETWTIPSNTTHRAEAGPDGASVLDVFAPPRTDWEQAPAADAAPRRWP
jgi:quercetin dioxygenase-like cupin family protein